MRLFRLIMVVSLCCPSGSYAAKQLIYDEEKGIIFVDPDAPPEEEPSRDEPPQKKAVGAVPQIQSIPSSVVKKQRPKEDIHIGRKKDPPNVYFSSGLEYFKNRDFENAFRNFAYADSVDPQPKYALWKGKCLRKLNRTEQMLSVMNTILKTYPNSDVADDALFEIAFNAQVEKDYSRALGLYKRLAEQYPFGRSYSNNQEFREIARVQARAMEQEMISALDGLGIQDGDLGERLKAFQQQYNLKPSGEASAETVLGLLRAHEKMVQDQRLREQMREKTRGHAGFGYALAGAMMVFLIFQLGMAGVVRTRKEHIITLQQVLSDLDPE